MVASRAITPCGPPEEHYEIKENVKIHCDEFICHFSCFSASDILNFDSSVECKLSVNKSGIEKRPVWSPTPWSKGVPKLIQCFTPTDRTPCGSLSNKMKIEDDVIVNCKGLSCHVKCKRKSLVPSVDKVTCKNKKNGVWSEPNGSNIYCYSPEIQSTSYTDYQYTYSDDYNYNYEGYDDIDEHAKSKKYDNTHTLDDTYSRYDYAAYDDYYAYYDDDYEYDLDGFEKVLYKSETAQFSYENLELLSTNLQLEWRLSSEF